MRSRGRHGGLLGGARSDDEQSSLRRQIDAVDHAIDLRVFEIYGLSQKEMGIVSPPAVPASHEQRPRP